MLSQILLQFINYSSQSKYRMAYWSFWLKDSWWTMTWQEMKTFSANQKAPQTKYVTAFLACRSFQDHWLEDIWWAMIWQEMKTFSANQKAPQTEDEATFFSLSNAYKYHPAFYKIQFSSYQWFDEQQLFCLSQSQGTDNIRTYPFETAGAVEYRLHLCRGVRSHPMSVLDMTLSYLMVRLQSWSFGECRVLLHCH